MDLEPLRNTKFIIGEKLRQNSDLTTLCQRWFGDVSIPDAAFLGAYDAGHSCLYEHMLVHPNAFPSVNSHTAHFANLEDTKQTEAHYRINQIFYFAELFHRGELSIDDREFAGLIATFRQVLEQARRQQNDGIVPFSPLSGRIVSIDHDSSFENGMPEKLRKYNKDVVLVLVLRDPVERLLSHYNRVRLRLYKPGMPLEELIEIDRLRLSAARGRIDKGDEKYYRQKAHTGYDHYIYRGMYASQLKDWLTIFPLEQFFIVSNTELSDDTPGILKRLYDRLGLPDIDIPEKSYFPQPTPRVRQPLDEETKKILTDFYRPYDEMLFNMIGRKLY